MQNPLLINWFWPGLALLMGVTCMVVLVMVFCVIRRDNKRMAANEK